MSFPDIAHETHGAESTVEYAYAATNVRNCSAGENMEVILNTFKQVMNLPANAQWKADPDKEVASLKKERGINPPADDRCPHRTQDYRQMPSSQFPSDVRR